VITTTPNLGIIAHQMPVWLDACKEIARTGGKVAKALRQSVP